MTPEEREFLGRVWTGNGIAEHSSIASFARFVLHLMSLGAPPELLIHSIDAMKDEVHHARACFGVAARFTGVPASPGPLDLDRSMAAPDGAESILEAAIAEGCVGETVSLRYLEIALERTDDDEIRGLLTRLSVDEARHAELAWRFLEWMLTVEPALAESAEACFERARAMPPCSTDLDEPPIASRYGYVPAREQDAVRQAMLTGEIAIRSAAIIRAASSASGGHTANAKAASDTR